MRTFWPLGPDPCNPESCYHQTTYAFAEALADKCVGFHRLESGLPYTAPPPPTKEYLLTVQLCGE